MSISRRAMVESLPDPPKRMSADAAARKFELQQPLAGGRIVSWRKLPLLRRVAGKPRKIRARTMHLQIFGDDVPSAVNGDANRDFNLATDRIARAARNGRNLFMRHRGCHGRRCYRGRRWRSHRGLLRGNRSCNGRRYCVYGYFRNRAGTDARAEYKARAGPGTIVAHSESLNRSEVRCGAQLASDAVCFLELPRTAGRFSVRCHPRSPTFRAY